MNKRMVLCVDDEANILSSLSRLLRKEDYKLITANGGSQGLSLLEKETVQVVISDQKMPEMTGTEFLQKVKDRFPDTVRVVLSGDADLNIIVESINKGEVYRFLPKPWNDEELKVIIRQCFEQYDLLQQNRSLMKQIQAQNEELKRLNEGLEKMIAERTQSLRLSQAILSKLPIPVLGVSQDGRIVLTNEAVEKTFPALNQVPMGIDMREILSQPMVATVEQWLAGNSAEQPAPFEMLGRQVRLRIMPIKESELIKGYVLMFNEI